MEIEICAYSVEACRVAAGLGVNRVELCGGMYDGGTTPSAGMIRAARKILSTVELYVMIRPRGGDFLYSDPEYEQMQEDIRFAGETGADGVVLGILCKDGSVDVERTKRLVELAKPMKVTFHRAFDMTCDYRQALEDVVGTGCCRILTSGQQTTAEEGVKVIRELVKEAAGRVQIMAGCGVNAGNATLLTETGADALHLSAKNCRPSQMIYRNAAVSMGGVAGIPEYEIAYCDEKKISDLIEKIR